MSDNFDFGFTTVDELPPSTTTTSEPPPSPVDTEQFNAVLNKLERLEGLVLRTDNSDMINEHRELLQQDVLLKLKQVEDLILPLLYNLQKNPERDYILWPNRVSILDAQIEKIKSVTRFYNEV